MATAKQIHSATYRAANKERTAAYNAAYYAANKEQAAATHAAWCAANKARRVAQQAAWGANNKERKAAVGAAWDAANRERRIANRAAYYAANKERSRVYGLKRRTLRAGAAGVCGLEQKVARWAMWGDKCWMCGAPATCTDHVKPLNKGGSNWPANLRPACRACNASKNDKWPFSHRWHEECLEVSA